MTLKVRGEKRESRAVEFFPGGDDFCSGPMVTACQIKNTRVFKKVILINKIKRFTKVQFYDFTPSPSALSSSLLSPSVPSLGSPPLPHTHSSHPRPQVPTQPAPPRPPATTRLPLPQNPSLPTASALPLRRCRRLAPSRIARCPAAATPETLAHSPSPSLPTPTLGSTMAERKLDRFAAHVKGESARSEPLHQAGRGRSDLRLPWIGLFSVDRSV
jgi:hypothetical protein